MRRCGGRREFLRNCIFFPADWRNGDVSDVVARSEVCEGAGTRWRKYFKSPWLLYLRRCCWSPVSCSWNTDRQKSSTGLPLPQSPRVQLKLDMIRGRAVTVSAPETRRRLSALWIVAPRQWRQSRWGAAIKACFAGHERERSRRRFVPVAGFFIVPARIGDR
jgi:hypothetical protein